jgi:ParB-like chromosome segregation protein Spo0J
MIDERALVEQIYAVERALHVDEDRWWAAADAFFLFKAKGLPQEQVMRLLGIARLKVAGLEDRFRGEEEEMVEVIARGSRDAMGVRHALNIARERARRSAKHGIEDDPTMPADELFDNNAKEQAYFRDYPALRQQTKALYGLALENELAVDRARYGEVGRFAWVTSHYDAELHAGHVAALIGPPLNLLGLTRFTVRRCYEVYRQKYEHGA